MRRIQALLFAALFLTGCSRTQPEREVSSTPGIVPFRIFVDEYFQAYFSFYPSEATAAGFHDYDTKLEDFSSARMRSRSAELRQQLSLLETIQKQDLTPEERIDATLLDGKIRAELLDIDTIRWWRRNGIPYVTAPGQAADLIMKRTFASPQDRLRTLTARLEGVEKLLEAMRNNVTEPPREFTELANRISKGSVDFFRNTATAWAKEAAGGNDVLFAEFQAVNRKVVNAFEVTSNFLAVDQMPLSTGAYAIGADSFLKKLRYEEMIDIPLDQLLAIGEQQLEKDYKAFVEAARRVRPNGPPADAMRSLADQHPTEAQLLDFAKATLEDIRKFVVNRKILAIPSEVRPTILETPPYARSGAFASMDTPGAYEAVAKEAFYYITPPEKDWARGHKEELCGCSTNR